MGTAYQIYHKMGGKSRGFMVPQLDIEFSILTVTRVVLFHYNIQGKKR